MGYVAFHLLVFVNFSHWAASVIFFAYRGFRVSPRIFNPADYAEPSTNEDSYGNTNTWSNPANFEPDDGTSK